MQQEALGRETQPFRDPVIELYKRDVDRSLIAENLRLSVQQRFEQLMQLQRFAEELQSARKRPAASD